MGGGSFGVVSERDWVSVGEMYCINRSIGKKDGRKVFRKLKTTPMGLTNRQKKGGGHNGTQLQYQIQKREGGGSV